MKSCVKLEQNQKNVWKQKIGLKYKSIAREFDLDYTKRKATKLRENSHTYVKIQQKILLVKKVQKLQNHLRISRKDVKLCKNIEKESHLSEMSTKATKLCENFEEIAKLCKNTARDSALCETKVEEMKLCENRKIARKYSKF